MDNIKISIIMASYNHEKYISRAIESILTQTYTDWELIIIDDASTDRSADIVDSFKDLRIRFYRSNENIGAISTFNNLLKKATGKYVAFIGSDDVWYKEKLEEQIQVLEENSDIAACFTQATMIDEYGELYTESDTDIPVSLFENENKSQGEWVKSFFESGNSLCHPSAVIRRNVIRDIGEFNLCYRQLHDFDYWTKIILKYNIVVIQKPLIHYRRKRKNNNSISASNVKNIIRDINESQTIILEMIKNVGGNIFLEGFSENIKKKGLSETELICEKFFLLLNWKKAGINNRRLAICYIEPYIVEEKVLKCLKEEYNYTINDYYTEMASPYLYYPSEYSKEYSEMKSYFTTQNEMLADRIHQLEEEIGVIHKTVSWRITKPLRGIRKLWRKR